MGRKGAGRVRPRRVVGIARQPASAKVVRPGARDAPPIAIDEELRARDTELFRHRDVLERVCARVVELALGSPSSIPLRVWVPSCSTGEDVFTIAMLLVEKLGSRHSFQVFGSDLDQAAIDVARRGDVPARFTSQLTRSRLERFFERDEGGYRIRPDVRERCVFVRHDLVADPPFSKLDLVFCRNALASLGRDLQRKAVPILHYALNPLGHLLLSPGERVNGLDAYFLPVEPDCGWYVRKPRQAAPIALVPRNQIHRVPSVDTASAARSKLAIQRDADLLLLSRYVPACVVVDEHLDVLQFRGKTNAYLEHPAGLPQLNIVHMARGDLAGEIRSAVQRAHRTGLTVRKAAIQLSERGRVRLVDIEVVPLVGEVEPGRYFAIVFEERPCPTPPARQKGKRSARDEEEVIRLRQELEASKEYIRSVSAQQLDATEELSSLNEELQSMNEELQSTNEELQTSKEELQSTNEELEKINEELRVSNAAIHQTNDDLVNVLASIDIAIIIVDANRIVRRFTPKPRAVLKLLPNDIGRPLADLQPTFPSVKLETAITGVIETLVPYESEIETTDGTTYRMQVRPYRTLGDRIDGAVVSFVDVTTLRSSIDAARAASEYANAIIQSVPSPLVVLDRGLRVHSANRAFVTTFGTNGALLDSSLEAKLHEAFTTDGPIDEVELTLRTPERRSRKYLLTATPVTIARQPFVVAAFSEITARRRLEEIRHAANLQRETFLSSVSDELRMPLSAILLWVDVLRGLEHNDPQFVTAVETIADCTRTEARLVDDLLDLAMSASGELEVDSMDMDPAASVRTAVDSVRPLADTHRVSLSTQLTYGTRVHVDAQRLQQILGKLLANALEFTPAGGSVRVSLGQEGNLVTIRVVDTGRGIASDFLPKAFEPFTQEDSSPTRTHRGLGIGLSLVRYLVTRLGGTIDAASVEGKGTTITVRFPATNHG